MHLLAKHLLANQPDSTTVGKRPFKVLQENIPPEDRKALVVPGSWEKTFANIQQAVKK
ncbi:MAG: hypothetical protein HC880_08615 [Bacteroidia bacterium]|nr:hypothetical protein [Bacteroidia bacterium]